MICLYCKKKIYEDEWSNYVSEDDYSEEYGPGVCSIDLKGFIVEHSPELNNA